MVNPESRLLQRVMSNSLTTSTVDGLNHADSDGKHDDEHDDVTAANNNNAVVDVAANGVQQRLQSTSQSPPVGVPALNLSGAMLNNGSSDSYDNASSSSVSNGNHARRASGVSNAVSIKGSASSTPRGGGGLFGFMGGSANKRKNNFKVQPINTINNSVRSVQSMKADFRFNVRTGGQARSNVSNVDTQIQPQHGADGAAIELSPAGATTAGDQPSTGRKSEESGGEKGYMISPRLFNRSHFLSRKPSKAGTEGGENPPHHVSGSRIPKLNFLHESLSAPRVSNPVQRDAALLAERNERAARRRQILAHTAAEQEQEKQRQQ